MSVKLFLCSLLLLMMCFTIVEARTFTNTKGQKIEAEVLKLEGDVVTVKLLKNGQTFSLKLERLIKDDQDFIENWGNSQKESPAEKQDLTSNFDDPWPGYVSIEEDPEIIVVEEDSEKERFVYHSPHYEFICDVRLKTSVIRAFSRMFEATFQVMVELPIDSKKARDFDSKKRMPILLFENKQTYAQNGGPPFSAGVYMPRTNTVMVPLTSLGVVKSGSAYRLDRKENNTTLVHELVHQLTDLEYYSKGSLGWFTEGIAEYVANSPYRGGRFNFKSNIRDLQKYVTASGDKNSGGRNLGEEVVVHDLKSYMLQPYSQFLENANFNYGLGLILVTYFIHMDDNGSRKNMNAFLKAMEKGKKGKKGKKGEELLDVLLAGRSWEQLEEEIHSAWKRKGIDLEFK